MSNTGQGKFNIENFLAAVPGSADWAGAAAGLAARFGRLEVEDQVRAAERLAGLGADEGVGELMDRLFGSAGVSLPALVILARARVAAGRESTPDLPPDLPSDLEKWLNACEGDQADCNELDFFSLPESARAAVRDHLALWMKAEVLARLKDAASDKTEAKQLAKALHRAKSAGATLPTPDGGTTFVMPDREDYVDEAYLSPPDGFGYYFIYLYRTVGGKNNLFVLMLNDREGVLRFDNYLVTRPRFDRIIASTRKNPHAVIVKVDPGYIRRMVRQAEASGIQQGARQHQDYLSKRRALGIADEPEGDHPVWSLLDRDQLSGERGLVFRSDELARRRIFEDWRLEALEEGKLMSALAELDQSLIELTPAQKKERESDLYAQEAARAVEGVGREVWRDRLLTCAYLLALMEQDEPARMAAAVALTVERPSEPMAPFFIELLRRGVARDLAPDDGTPSGPDPDRGGLIVT